MKFDQTVVLLTGATPLHKKKIKEIKEIYKEMDSLYSYPEDQIAIVRQQKLWCQDPKYFKKVKINPSAAIKMITHGQQGVDKGISRTGTPTEVMGLLLGRPDHEDPHSFIISDALPLPIEGFETRVVADDVSVLNYMIELGESIEATRKEKFCGWYHTHPFDLDGTSHCFLSNTDITTQLHWQRSEDPHGNPWLAIVIDPLLSIHTNKPQLQAFRVYPPDYSPPANETPDGKIVKNDAQRIAQWGVCWNRYYVLSVEYYMSNMAKDILEKLKNRFMWSQPLISDNDGYSLTSDTAQELKEIAANTARLQRMAGGGGWNAAKRRGAGSTALPSSLTPPPVSIHGAMGSAEEEEGVSLGSSSQSQLQRVTQSTAQLGTEHMCRICSQVVKQAVFCLPSLAQAHSKEKEHESKDTMDVVA